MTKQERGLKTRDALVRAAAAQFDRHGYAGTSLARIRDAARISMGALTFHFPTKADLADALEETAGTMTTEVVERVSAQRGPGLASAVQLTIELTRLLQEHEVVRAAARLARERPESPDWSAVWLPVMRRFLRRARREGSLSPPAHPEAVTSLMLCLLDGMDATLRRRAGGTARRVNAVRELEEIWRLILADPTPFQGPPIHLTDGGKNPMR